MIVAASGLSEDHLGAIARLEAACAGDGRLKLEWETLRSRPTDQPRDFLWVAEPRDEVVGFLGLYNFGTGLTEVCGMVHPEYRRTGIFSRLLAASESRALPYETAGESDQVQRLVVVNRDSETGRQLALSIGAALEHSEYEMVLGRPCSPEQFRRHEELVVRDARESDRETLAVVLAAAFSTGDGQPLESVNIAGVTAIEYRGVTVGMLRASAGPEGAWISGFAIAPEMRGRGFGHQVLAEVVHALVESGASKVSLDVATDNARALGLYTDIGFEQVGAMDYYAYAFTPGSTTNATRQ